MNAFEKIIGYDAIKTELLQVIDMIKNPECYINLGATIPRGILLDGDPGLGKSLMCKCFIEEAELPYFTVRRDSGAEDFINKITETFHQAKAQAPSIVFLDDMDKFANEDSNHRDAPEYVAIQSGIDSVRDSVVIVLATTNGIGSLPESLLRPGRFDRTIDVPYPSYEDASKILGYYLKNKNISPDVNFDDIVKMVGCNACCVLETAMNEAAIYAAFDRAETIRMEHILKAVLRLKYDCPDDTTVLSTDEVKKMARHEAGHLVVAEVLSEGSIGIASIRRNGRSDSSGFVHRYVPLTVTPHDVLISLAGKASAELYYPGEAEGCQYDIARAITKIEESISEKVSSGLFLLDSSSKLNSETLTAYQEGAIRNELQHYYDMTRSILIENREFLDKATIVLAEKETLLASDIQKLRESCTIKPFRI